MFINGINITGVWCGSDKSRILYGLVMMHEQPHLLGTRLDLNIHKYLEFRHGNYKTQTKPTRYQSYLKLNTDWSSLEVLVLLAWGMIWGGGLLAIKEAGGSNKREGWTYHGYNGVELINTVKTMDVLTT